MFRLDTSIFKGLTLARQHQAVADRHQRNGHTLVPEHLGVEGADRPGFLVLAGIVGDRVLYRAFDGGS